MERSIYDQLCEDALDFWAGGAAQRAHLQHAMVKRLGEADDPTQDPASDRRQRETDDADIIRSGHTELYTVPYLRAIVEELAVLYSSDGFHRSYVSGGKEQLEVGQLLGWYHDEGWLEPRLQLVDSYVVLLRTAHLLVRWCEELGRISYDVMPPHWVWVLPHDRHPLEARLAIAVAYPERSNSSSKSVWCAYVRAPLPGDTSPELRPGGRLVRYEAGFPFPIPKPGDGTILEDGPNPLIEIGGMDDGRTIWSPIVWCWAEPPTEQLHLLPSDDLVRANAEIDIALSMVLYTANLQSAGQPYITGSHSPPRELGPTKLVVITEPQGQFGFASPQADIAGHVDVIQRLLQIQSMLRHLAPDTYSLQRPSVQTGPAKLLEQNALVEARSRRTKIAERSERDLFDIERLLHNAYGSENGEAIPWDCRLSVMWGELRVPPDRTLQVQRLQQEVASGISSILDAVMEVWGLDREGAIAKLTDNAEVARIFGTTGVVEDTDEVVEDTGGEKKAEASEQEDEKPVEEKPAEAVAPDTALNGAQVTALLDVVGRVSYGLIPRETAVEIIATAFPVSREDADRILGKIGQGFVPQQAQPESSDGNVAADRREPVTIADDEGVSE